MDTKQLLWKKSIKRFQSIFLIMAVLCLYVWNNTLNFFHENQAQIQNLQKVTMEVKQIEDKIQKVKDTTTNLTSIEKNQSSFMKSYNTCYIRYVWKKYDFIDKKFDWDKDNSFKKCMSSWYPKVDDFKNFNDEQLVNIWTSMWIHKEPSTWNESKMNFNQKRVLYSLDRNIFGDNLETRSSMISFSNPTLMDSNLKLYKVSFTLTTDTNFDWFMSILRKLQNEMYVSWNLYYTIWNISKFDIMEEDKIQKINIQWNFYFTR